MVSNCLRGQPRAPRGGYAQGQRVGLSQGRIEDKLSYDSVHLNPQFRDSGAPQHFLDFFPLPRGQGSFRRTFGLIVVQDHCASARRNGNQKRNPRRGWGCWL